MTLEEAYQDFMVWAFLPENKSLFSANNRHYFNKTSGDIPNGKCGPQRIKNIFRKFARDRYVVSETVVLVANNDFSPKEDTANHIHNCPNCGDSFFDIYPAPFHLCPTCKAEHW